MSRLRLVAAEAVRSITANISTTVAATLTVLIGMFLVGLLIGFGSYARSWSDQKKEELLVKVFFCTEATCAKEVTPKQIDAVRAKLEGEPARPAGHVRFEGGSARAHEGGRAPELVRRLPSNPLPDAEEVQPIRGEATQRIADSLKPLPAGVEKVTYGQKTAERILDIARLIEILFLVAVIVLLAASTVLIANTIRLSIFARRREIEVMKLVGASNWFVRGPFMLEGLICGFAGALLAVILLLVGKEVALPELGWFDDPDVHSLAFGLNALILIGLGLLLGAAGSAVTLRRFLRV